MVSRITHTSVLSVCECVCRCVQRLVASKVRGLNAFRAMGLSMDIKVLANKNPALQQYFRSVPAGYVYVLCMTLYMYHCECIRYVLLALEVTMYVDGPPSLKYHLQCMIRIPPSI